MPAPARALFRLLLQLAALALAGFAVFAGPALAQSAGVASGVSFYERVRVGDVEVTPFNISYDDRCPDLSFCTRSDRMVISVALHGGPFLREIVLELGRPSRVPGGWLTLTSAGTPASRQGAIELEKYQLELVFYPDRRRAPLGS